MQGYAVAIRRAARVASFGVLLLSFIVAGMGCAGAQKKKEKQFKDAQWDYEMGAGYFSSHEIPLAIRYLTLSLRKNPNNYRAHYLLGFIYMGRRNYPETIYHFKEALRIKPNYDFAKNDLGAAYLATERWEDAAKIFRGLLKEPLYATPELAHNNLGWAYYKLGRYEKAIEQFKSAIFLEPKMCLAYNNMGIVYESMGDDEEAIRSFDKAVRHCPNNYAEPHFHLGKLLERQGSRRARLEFRRCVQLQPDSDLADRCRQYLRVQ